MVTVFLIFFPLLAALGVLFVPPRYAKSLTFIASLMEAVVTLGVVYLFNRNSDVQFVVDVPWIASLGVNFSVGIDGISLVLVLLTNILVPFIILSSSSDKFEKPIIFYGLILLMQMALIGVFVAMDGFLFYLFWELALIPIYFICLIWGGDGRAHITLKFFIYTLAGSLIMLVALVYLYLQTADHTFAINALYKAGQGLTYAEQSILFWGLFVAFAVKMPVFPFHTWQPDTYSTAPAQGTMLLSGIMLKMGIYGVLRWLVPVVPIGVQAWGLTAIILSVIGIVYASCLALIQKDFKRLIAYSSIAHVGLIAAGLLTLTEMGVQGAMIQMFNHGIIVVGLFYIIEIIFDRTKTRAISSLGGIRTAAPILTTTFGIVMLGSIALPFTSGFVGEFLLLTSLFQYKATVGAVAGVTVILGAVYMLKAFQRSMSGETNDVTAGFKDLTTQEKLILFPIVLLIVMIGVYPAPLLDLSEPAVIRLLSIFNDVTASSNGI